MNTRITTIVVGLLLTMFLAGGAFAQVPSSVTQQLRLSTGGVTPNYVQHRAIAGSIGAPAANGWYAWDQVPDRSAPANQGNNLLFLNNLNEVRQGTRFTATQANFLVTINAAGDNIAYLDPSTLIVAQNGLTENPSNTIELGGDLLHNTTIDQSGFNMRWVDSSTTSSFNVVAVNTGTMNVNIDPGTNGFLNLKNIDAGTIEENFMVIDASGNVLTRPLTGIIDANNGVTEQVIAGVSTVQLGAAATGGSTLLTNRFISLNGQNMNWEGSGNFNLGTAAGDMSVNINTGTLGNVSLQGTTLNGVANLTNFLYTDGNNVRRATASSIAAGTAATYMAVDAGGAIVRAPSPLAGIYRGQITGTGTFTYGPIAIATLPAGSSIVCTVENHSGVLGSVSVQVTSVSTGSPGSFSVEASENIQSGSFINYIVMNP